MEQLPKKIVDSFEEGQFSIKQKPGKFNGIAGDMGTEKTVIKNSKGKSCLLGITRQKAAIVRLSLSRHILGQYTRAMKEFAATAQEKNVEKETLRVHPECQPTAMKHDETHLTAIINHINTSMTDPCDIEKHPSCFIKISNGLHSSPEVQKSLLGAVYSGNTSMEKFVDATLSIGKEKSLYSAMPRSGVIGFQDMNKKAISKNSKGITIHLNISPEMVFRRAMAISAVREDINMESILSHPVGAVPLSMFHEDGQMHKNQKSDLGVKLEKSVKSALSCHHFENKTL